MPTKVVALILLVMIMALPLAQAQENSLTVTLLGTYTTGVFDEGAAEIGAYHAATQRVFVVNGALDGIDILDISDPSAPSLVSQVDMSEVGSPNSVAVSGDTIAVALNADDAMSNGTVVFINPEGEILNQVEVGVLPDMIIFTPDGSKALTANEAEPGDIYEVDPEGSVSIIDVSGGVEAATVNTISFADLTADDVDGLRIFGPNASIAQDLEPEYIAISADSSTAYVTLQENNGLMIIDIASASISAVLPLGTKDHSLEGNGLDASNEDGAINIQTYPVQGFYLPDAITIFESNGVSYLITANEGDAREYAEFDDDDNVTAGYVEETRVKDVTLDETVFPNATELQDEAVLGRLKITIAQGDTDGDGDYDVLYSYGARSFTVWNAATGEIVFDSGDQLERITAEAFPDDFNSSNDENGSFDDRSDDKGPEAEAVTVGEVNGVLYAFVGMERISAIAVYNMTDPTAPEYVTLISNRDFSGDAEAGTAGDLGPEGLTFISADQSPTGKALLVTLNEVSGSTSIYELE